MSAVAVRRVLKGIPSLKLGRVRAELEILGHVEGKPVRSVARGMSELGEAVEMGLALATGRRGQNTMFSLRAWMGLLGKRRHRPVVHWLNPELSQEFYVHQANARLMEFGKELALEGQRWTWLRENFSDAEQEALYLDEDFRSAYYSNDLKGAGKRALEILERRGL